MKNVLKDEQGSVGILLSSIMLIVIGVFVLIMGTAISNISVVSINENISNEGIVSKTIENSDNFFNSEINKCITGNTYAKNCNLKTIHKSENKQNIQKTSVEQEEYGVVSYLQVIFPLFGLALMILGFSYIVISFRTYL